jgi:mono/diheme cytochrome c family protein
LTVRFALSLLLALLLLAAAGLAFVYLGAYDVAATRPHTALVEGLLETLRTRSVAARADGVPDPPPVDADLLAEGFEHYEAMCVACHGAPGRERGELGQGMTPEPPHLAEDPWDLSEREVFWIVKNGIKLAGMPAFGPTHSDRQIWGLVAVVRRLPRMDADEYRRQFPDEVRDPLGADSLHPEDGHEHGPGEDH